MPGIQQVIEGIVLRFQRLKVEKFKVRFDH